MGPRIVGPVLKNGVHPRLGILEMFGTEIEAGQLQQRAMMFGILLFGTGIILERRAQIAIRLVKQAKLIIWLGESRLDLEGISEFQPRLVGLALCNQFLAMLHIFGSPGI